MSYTPTNWQTGDIVTADKLNKLENGVASGGMLITISQSGGDTVLDKNYTEIKTAIESGIFPFALMEDEEGSTVICTVCNYAFIEDAYGVILHSDLLQKIMPFTSDTADGVLKQSK